MKINPLSHKRSYQSGFTLIEMTLYAALSVVVSVVSLLLLNQLIFFHDFVRRQDFLSSEAPAISGVMGNFLEKSSGFELYTSHSSYLDTGTPVSSNAKSIRFIYLLPDNTSTSVVISFIPGTNGPGILGVYSASGTAPDWRVSSQVQDVNFFIQQGILRLTLTGTRGEEVTYSGAMKL